MNQLQFSVLNGAVSLQADGIEFRGAHPQVVLLEEGNPAPLVLSPLGTPTESASGASTQTLRWQTPRGYVFTFSCTTFPDKPAIALQMSFENRTTKPVRLREFLLSSGGLLKTTGAPKDWFLSSLTSYDFTGGGPVASGHLDADATYRFVDTLTLYTDHGRRGLAIGPIGPGVSDLRFRCAVRSGAVSLDIASEMTDILVDPGETRISEQAILYAGPHDDAITTIFKSIAATHGARLQRGPVFGWCSWYDCKMRITQWHSMGIARAVKQLNDRIPMQVIQIDDGWQKDYGNWTIQPMRFPRGMKFMADYIRDVGAMAGIWMCLVRTSEKGVHPDGTPNEYQDATHPAVQDYIRKTIADSLQEGYNYFKFDFNSPRIPDRKDQKKTRLQVHRDLFKLYREAVGESSYLLACVGGLSRGCVGYADAARIGTDSCDNWGGLLQGCTIVECISAVGSTALANGILYANDPDVTYTLPRGTLTADEVRTWHSFVGLLGGLMLVSEPIHEPMYDEPDAIRMLEILNPPAPDKGRSFTGGTDPYHRQFGFVAQRPWGNFASLLLWNPDDKPADVPLRGVPTAPLGKQFHVWSFWDEKYMGVCDDSFAARVLAPHSPAVLRLTAVAPKPNQPVLVGSNLHIALGSAEIQSIQTDDQSMTITLTDAGAREGKLFIHSPRELSIHTATGCSAAIVAGNSNIWTIALADRQRNTPNVIRLTVGK